MFCSQAPKLQTWSKVFLHCYIPVIHNVYMLLYGKLSQFCCLQNRKGYRIHWWIQKGVGVGGGGFGGSNLILFYFEHMTCYKTFYIYLKAIFPSIIILYKCFKKLSYLKKVVQWTNVIYILKKKWSSPSLWLFSQIKGTLTPHTQTDLLYPKSSLNLLL